MNNLPEEIFLKILNYLDCIEYTRHDILCKFANKNCKCKLLKFCNLYGCKYHSINKFKVAKKLLNYNIEYGTIHFDSESQLKIAKPYLNYCGRKISHFCCKGRGVTFLSKDGMRKYEKFY